MKQVAGASQVGFFNVGEWECTCDQTRGEVVPFCAFEGFRMFVWLPSLLSFDVFALLPSLKAQVSSLLYKINGYSDNLYGGYMSYLLCLWIELIYSLFKRFSICLFLLGSKGWLRLSCKERIPLMVRRWRAVCSCFFHVDFVVDKNLRLKAQVRFSQGIHIVSMNSMCGIVFLVNLCSWISGITSVLHLPTLCVSSVTF